MMRSIDKFFDGKSYVYQLMYFCLLVCVFKILLLPFAIALKVIYPDISVQGSRHTWFDGLVYAPLLETLIFQLLIIRLLLLVSYFKQRPLLIFCISALLFGVAHTGNTTVLNATLAGIVLAYIYHYYYSRAQSGKAYWSTAIVHSASNLFAMLAAMLLT
ncbi:MAG: CPBP family intramembrane metalloprotease [Chitinophagaceae bacterium]|nr:CPBP family intramembrane metalloprotease [Chitinophagaceae bacterium]MCB9044874.1 CPBP family intramembrane metalloprotease [Chitinophagales bacterium]